MMIRSSVVACPFFRMSEIKTNPNGKWEAYMHYCTKNISSTRVTRVERQLSYELRVKKVQEDAFRRCNHCPKVYQALLDELKPE